MDEAERCSGAGGAAPLVVNEPLLSALQRVTPELGHTPDAVQVTTAFVAPDKAVGAHSESDDADFRDYQIVDAIVLDTRARAI